MGSNDTWEGHYFDIIEEFQTYAPVSQMNTSHFGILNAQVNIYFGHLVFNCRADKIDF